MNPRTGYQSVLQAGILFLLAGFMANALAEDISVPSALVLIDAKEFKHEVRVGYRYSNKWVRRGPLLEKSSREALKPYFTKVELCEGNAAADVIVWLKPRLFFNPIDGYEAKVRANFYLGNGKRLGHFNAIGKQSGAMDSNLVEVEVQQAFDKAIQDIARQYVANEKVQEAIRSAMVKGITHAPCNIVAMVPNP